MEEYFEMNFNQRTFPHDINLESLFAIPKLCQLRWI